MKRVKSITAVICFLVIVWGIALHNLVDPDFKLPPERHGKPVNAPIFTFEKFLNGRFFEEIEDFYAYTFPLRDTFSKLNQFCIMHLFNQKDINGFYIEDDKIIKMEYKLNENSVINASEKLNEICDRYLPGNNIFYSVIPDKNYFAASKTGHLSMDYERIVALLEDNVVNMKYIDLFDSLELGDFYGTDLHWNQESILNTADKLMTEMGNSVSLSESEYTRNGFYPFYGSYHRQSGISIEPEELIYLTNSTTKNAVVYDFENQKYGSVYDVDKLSGTNPYDVFLSGSKALITITSPNSNFEKELILFRDSFGSSIAPLLLASYSKITLVDLRYIATDLLGEFIDFNQAQDVCFLYSTPILNNSYMLK